MQALSVTKTNKITVLVFQQLITSKHRAKRRQREGTAHAYMITTQNTAGWTNFRPTSFDMLSDVVIVIPSQAAILIQIHIYSNEYVLWSAYALLNSAQLTPN